MSATQLSLLEQSVAQVRRSDPKPAKDAAAKNLIEKKRQWKVLLGRLHDGPISADTAGVVIGRHRSTASARLGVMMRRGLVEPAGQHMEPPAEGGAARPVLRYRLTEQGEREYGVLFGGAS